MATKYPQGPGRPRGDEIHPLDIVSCTNELTKKIPAAKVALTILFVTFFNDNTKEEAVLYHCQIDHERRTFLKGKWETLGLNDPAEEHECEELRGKYLVQALITTNLDGRGVVYAIDEEGVLWSLGANNWSQLGRPTSNTISTTFGQVSIVEPILELACGMVHCLARTAERVFAFGLNNCGQTGVGRGGSVNQPTEIHRGTGDAAPVQVEAGAAHSAILTNDGKVRTFGAGNNGRTGHGGTNDIYKPTPIKVLKEKVEQIGCTDMATFFLVDGKMFGCGYNGDSRLGVGRNKEVTVPTLVNTEGHNITSFRCSRTLVVAYTELRDALVWGVCRDKVIIKVPQIEHLEFPRDFFSNGSHKDTGSSVHPESKVDELEQKLKYLNKDLESSKAREVSLERDLTTSEEKVCELGQRLKDLHKEQESSKSLEVSVQKDLAVYKLKLLELEEQHKQVKETHEQTEQQLLMVKRYHEDTQVQLQQTRSGQERTHQELEASKEKVCGLELNLKNLNKELESSKAQEGSLRNELTASKDKVCGIEQKLEDFAAKLDTSKAREGTLNKDLSASEDKVSELKENLKDRDQKLETSKIREGSLEKSLAASKEKVFGLEQNLKDLNEELKSSKAQEGSLRNELTASEDKMCELKENLKDRDEKLETSKIREGALEKSLTVYKHKLLELEKQHKQVKETHEQTEQQLLIEKTSHEETRLQLLNTKSDQERIQQEFKETKSKLEQEQKVHQETKSLLDGEKASHQETQIKLDQEKKAHGQTQSRLESEETKNKESQELLDAERNTFHQIQVQHLQQLHQQEQFRQETQSVLDEVRETNRQFQSQLDEKQAKMSLKKQEQKVEDKIQSLLEEEDRIHQEIQLDVGKGHEIQSDDSFLNDARKIHRKALLYLGIRTPLVPAQSHSQLNATDGAAAARTEYQQFAIERWGQEAVTQQQSFMGKQARPRVGRAPVHGRYASIAPDIQLPWVERRSKTEGQKSGKSKRHRSTPLI